MRAFVTSFVRALLVAALLATPALAIAAPAVPQPLAIDIHADGARATQLPEYDPGIPIAVSVKGTGGGALDSVTVIAAGPAGESVRVSLSPTADGSFAGTLELRDPGSWRLHLTSRAGTTSTDTDPVVLDVQPPPPSNSWQLGLAVGLGIFVVVGGTGFVALRRMAGGSGHPSTRAA